MKWTDDAINELLDLIILADTNTCMNKPELCEYFNISNSAIEAILARLRKLKILPKVDRLAQLDTFGRPYSQNELKFIINAVNVGASNQEIADNLERTYYSVHQQISRMMAQGKIEHRHRVYSEEEITILIENIKFDEHGCIKNYPELSRMLNVPKRKIKDVIYRLRKQGRVRKPRGVSIKSIEEFRKGNEQVFVRLA